MSATPLRLPRLPILVLAGLCLIAGLLTGLARIGWPLPVPRPGWIGLHGPVMAVGFLATLVSLERAVALGRTWAFAAPLLLASSALAALAGLGAPLAGGLATAGALLAVPIFAALLRRARRPPGHLIALAIGAVALVPGNLAWALGQPAHASVPWWIAFLVVTVAAERWERTRLRMLPPGAYRALAAAIALLLAGACVPLFDVRWGLRPMAPGLLAIAAWMLLHDTNRVASRQGGERRHVALCTLAGQLWLAAAGLLALLRGDTVVGPSWDAVLHALFVGFLFSMVFAHAPMVLVPLLGRRLEWTAAFHVPHALLHLGLVGRVAGDLSGDFELRRQGGLLGAVAILGFAVLAFARSRALRGAA